MSLFKRKKGKNSPCCCGSDCTTECAKEVSGKIKSIKVLGSGCKSCHQMYENVKQAVENIGLNIEVEYVTDMEKVMQYGVMSMPVLVVNDDVVSVGKVLKIQEILKIIK